MVDNYLFKDRDGQTPLPLELRKGLIPKNIQTVGELDEYEERNIAKGLVWLGTYSGKDHRKYNFWFKLHKRLFGDVWNWAGKERKHELQNPEFLLPHDIWPAIKKLEDDLEYWLTNRPFDDDREIAARFHERFETIHPFANGNGRAGRIVTEFLCKKEKIEIPTWGVEFSEQPKNRRKAYIEGLIAGRHRKYRYIKNFMYS